MQELLSFYKDIGSDGFCYLSFNSLGVSMQNESIFEPAQMLEINRCEKCKR